MSDPKGPFEAAVRAGCVFDRTNGGERCEYPHERCDKFCAGYIGTARTILAAALPPDPAPLEVMRDDGSYVMEEDVICTLRALRASLLPGEEPS